MTNRDISCADIVDELGRLKAKKADLEAREEELNSQLRDVGPGAYEGRLFRATVGEDGETTTYASKEMYERLWELGQYAFAKACRGTKPRKGAVRVVAKTGLGIVADWEREAA
jgi:hypothetical protein